MATTAEYIEQGTSTDVLTSELNSLTSGAMSAAGGEINNAQAAANLNGYTRAKVLLHLAAYTGTPAAGSALYLWWLLTLDGGVTYEDGGSGVTPARAPDIIIPIRAAASGPQTIVLPHRLIPAGKFKALAQDSGSGITWAASGNKISILPNAVQGV